MTTPAQPDASPAAAGFSASDSALDGLRVIRENWRLMIGWAVFHVVALVALVILSVIIMVALAIFGESAAAGQGIGAVIGGFGVAIIEVMIITALYRTLLRAEEPGFMNLRLGRDEMRLFAAWLALAAGTLVLLGAGWMTVAFVQRQAGTLPAFLAAVAWLAGMIYLAIRLSLALPATFAEQRFGFARSWRLTRGHTPSLLGMAALATSLLAMTVVVTWFALWLLVGSLSGFHDLGLSSLESPQAFSERPFAFLVKAAGEVMIGPLLLAISQAPLISAYRAFARDA